MSRGLLIVVVLAAGCGPESTLLTVRFTSDREVPAELDRLCVTTRTYEPNILAFGFDAVGEELGEGLLRGLPATMVLEDALDKYDEVLVTATGTLLGTAAAYGAGLWSLVDGDQREERLRVQACGPRRSNRLGLNGPLDTLASGLAGDKRVVLADLDADARAEIISAPARVDYLQIPFPLEQTAQWLLTTPVGPTRVAVGDLDHDCAPDILFASDDEVFPPLVSAPPGEAAFGIRGEASRVQWPSGGGGAIAIGDLDGSGAADVFVAGDGEYRVIRANAPREGTVTFGSSDAYVQPAGAFDGVGSAVALADLTADGTLDAVVGHAGASVLANTVRVFEGREEALAELPDALAVAEARDVSAIAIGPLDGDDTPDVLVVFAGAGGPAAALFTHHAEPTEARFGRAGTPVFPDGDGRDVALVDLDGDCDLDVVLAIGDAPSLVFEQTEDGLLQTTIDLPPAVAVAAGTTATGPDVVLRSVVVLLDAEGGGGIYEGDVAGVD